MVLYCNAISITCSDRNFGIFFGFLHTNDIKLLGRFLIDLMTWWPELMLHCAIAKEENCEQNLTFNNPYFISSYQQFKQFWTAITSINNLLAISIWYWLYPKYVLDIFHNHCCNSYWFTNQVVKTQYKVTIVILLEKHMTLMSSADDVGSRRRIKRERVSLSCSGT